MVKALTKFKKYILSNRDIKIVNGCRLNDPPEEIKEKYGIISHNIKSYFDNIREKNKFHDKIIEYYKNRKYKTINEIKEKEENDENNKNKNNIENKNEKKEEENKENNNDDNKNKKERLSNYGNNSRSR